MTNTKIVCGEILYRKELALKFFTLIVCLTVALCLLLYYKQAPIFQVIISLLIVMPLILINKISDGFKREIAVSLHDEEIKIVIKRKNGIITNSEAYSLVNVKWYKIIIPNRKFIEVLVRLKSNRSLSYSFITLDSHTDQADEEEFILPFLELFKNFNKGRADSDKIIFLPSFFASNRGLLCIIFLTLLIITEIAFIIIYHSHIGFFGLFISIAMLIQIIIRRNTDTDFYRRNRAKSFQ